MVKCSTQRELDIFNIILYEFFPFCDTVGAEGGCPSDWYKLDRKCYKLEGYDEPKTWQQAQAWCEANAIGDGALATIFHPGLQCKKECSSKNRNITNEGKCDKIWFGQ